MVPGDTPEVAGVVKMHESWPTTNTISMADNISRHVPEMTNTIESLARYPQAVSNGVHRKNALLIAVQRNTELN